jgi:hypothetical protein
MTGRTNSWALSAVILLAAMTLSCGPRTEEAEIREFLKETAALAEKRSFDTLMTRMAPDFRDFRGRDKAEAGALIEGHLRRSRGIVIHVLSVKAGEAEAGGEASVRAEILLSSGPAEALRKLVRYAGETYRLDLRLGPSGRAGRQIRYAAWEEVPVSGLFPESVKALKGLFPGL